MQKEKKPLNCASNSFKSKIFVILDIKGKEKKTNCVSLIAKGFHY